jgi:hypothetical protein
MSRSTYLIAAILYTGFALVVDVFLFHAIPDQLRSTHFATTEGRILASKVTTNRSSSIHDPRTYGVEVRYQYRVQGRRYESSQVRYGMQSDSSEGWARNTVSDNPVGAMRTVYYDPAAPDEAVLQTGIDPQENFLLFFVAPFNAFIIYVWAQVRIAARKVAAQGGAKIDETGSEIHIRFPRTKAIEKAFAAFVVAVIVMTVLIAVLDGWSPSFGLVTFAWVCALGSAMLGFVVQWRDNARPQPDIILQLEAGTLRRLSAPRESLEGRPTDYTTSMKVWREWQANRFVPVLVPLENVLSVETVGQTPRKEDQDPSWYFAVVVVAGSDGATKTAIPLAAWKKPEDAEEFAVWLRTKLGFAADAAPDEGGPETL